MSEARGIPEEFVDPAYVYAYADEYLATKIATQIRVLREQRGLTQDALARAIGTQQREIARLEDVNHVAWSLETLTQLAPALGVIFICGFVSVRAFLDEAAAFSRQALEQPSLEEEIAQARAASPSPT